MVMIPLFPIALVGAFVFLLVLRHRSGRWSETRGGPLLLFSALMASYGLAFALLNANPYYDDNGMPEFIELRYRWIWAAVLGGFFSLVGVPSAFALRTFWLWWRARKVGARDDSSGETA